MGAIAAVGGAFWVADQQVAQQRKTAAALIHEMYFPTAFALGELAFVYGPQSRPHRGDDDNEPDVFSVEKWSEIADHAGFVVDHHKKFNDRIHRDEAGLNLLSAHSLSTALALETALEDAIRDAVVPLRVSPQSYNFDTATVEYHEKAPTWSSRFALSVCNGQVQQYMAELERQATR